MRLTLSLLLARARLYPHSSLLEHRCSKNETKPVCVNSSSRTKPLPRHLQLSSTWQCHPPYLDLDASIEKGSLPGGHSYPTLNVQREKWTGTLKTPSRNYTSQEIS